jgi:hypothetical protein
MAGDVSATRIENRRTQTTKDDVHIPPVICISRGFRDLSVPSVYKLHEVL